MQRASMFWGIVLSMILPGAGLLLVQKGGMFGLYITLYIISFILVFFMGIGLFLMVPVWIASFIHTIVAISGHNKLAVIK